MAQNNAEMPNLSGGEDHTTVRTQQVAISAQNDERDGRNDGTNRTGGADGTTCANISSSNLNNGENATHLSTTARTAAAATTNTTTATITDDLAESSARLRDLRRWARRRRPNFDVRRPYRNTSLQEERLPEMFEDDFVRLDEEEDADASDDEDEREVRWARQIELTFEAAHELQHAGILLLGVGPFDHADGSNEATMISVAGMRRPDAPPSPRHHVPLRLPAALVAPRGEDDDDFYAWLL